MLNLKLSTEDKQKIIPFIQQYFADERDEEIGNLAAEFLLDFFVEKAGPIIYNQGLNAARQAIKNSADELEYRLYELEQPVSHR